MLSLAKPTVCSCKYNNCDLTFILFQRRKDAIESFEDASTSTSADQPKPKRRRKSKKLPPSSPLLSTHEEPGEVVEAMDVSCAVEASEGVSSETGQLAPWTTRPRQLAPDLKTTRPRS